ncbi:hypothetical protein PGT21_036606 [Puccinia graminis f. sp. tritici]|uniref:Uncharacterized protein n=1 Tax=Puccinia graminis f. sp. tritici TaxID=56615 RepID=A0A5B0PAG2_PUCGR|nr:hypothetical protein PGT21_036606 [Puccinia graminis f. sp. tritici]KAA1100421.1 hypothetical protein PGTUg99_027346 [Puccinia graminis f. sp. tritici]
MSDSNSETGNSSTSDDESGASQTSETGPKSKTDLVVEALDDMDRKYRFESKREADVDKNLTINDMGEKLKRLDELETSLLPSMEELIDQLLVALDIKGSSDYPGPQPDLDLTLEILSKLDKNLKRTVSSGVFLALESPLPDAEHDHHLDKAKIFRCTLLLHEIECLVVNQIYDLLVCCMSVVQWCESLSDCSEEALFQSEVLLSRREALMSATQCQHEIDRLIKFSQKSDLAILQMTWLPPAKLLNRVLVNFTHLTNPRFDSNPEPKRNFWIVEDRNQERAAPREEIAQVAKSTIPIIKLARILLGKLSRLSRKEVPFTLHSAIDSKSVNKLKSAQHAIAVQLDRIGLTLLKDHRTNEALEPIFNQVHTVVKQISWIVEFHLVDIAFHLVPLPHLLLNGVNSPTRHFRAQFCPWKQLWDVAVSRLLDFLCSIETEH